MKVCFDGSVFSLQKTGGISCYWAEYLKYFAETRRLEGYLTLYPGSEHNMPLKDVLAGLEPTIRPLRRNAAQMAIDLALGGSTGVTADTRIFHSPYYNLPRQTGKICNVLSINDLIYLEETAATLRYRVRRALNTRSVMRADRFVAISEETKRQLIRYFPKVKPEHVQVIHLAASDVFASPPAALSSTCPTRVPTSPFVLYVGKRGDYKNFDNFAKAFARSHKDIKALCIGGGPFTPAEQGMLASLGAGDRFLQAGGVSEPDLAVLYSRAVALVYPSKREGFGIPLLEAMAEGCPAICLRCSSMGEVAGSAGVYLSTELCENLPELLETVSGSARPGIVAAGRARAAQFSWRKSARQVFEYYERVLS